MNRIVTRASWLAGLAFAGYVGYGIYEAGLHDRPPPPATTNIIFKDGSAVGQRIRTRSWSADYERIVSNADQTVLDLDTIRHGVIYRKGKPYLRVRAAHMTVNTVARDFTALGSLHVETVGAKLQRSFDTTSAVWNDGLQTLTLAKHIDIHTAHDAPLSVGSLSINVKTGQIELHQVAGAVRFK